MWVDLVRMRQAGQKRPNEVVLRERPERGRLTLKKADSSEVTYVRGETEVAAFFSCLTPEFPAAILHRLHQASVSVIGDDSFVVVGIERIHTTGGRSQDFAQAWWCRVSVGPS